MTIVALRLRQEQMGCYKQGRTNPDLGRAHWRVCSGRLLAGALSNIRILEGDGSSDLELMQIRNAGAHLLQIHFDEIVPDAADFCRGEDFLPVQRALSYRHNFLGFRRPALHMHGNEAAGILNEIFRGVVTLANGRHLELEFHEFRNNLGRFPSPGR
jgi:hypothetical protein